MAQDWRGGIGAGSSLGMFGATLSNGNPVTSAVMAALGFFSSFLGSDEESERQKRKKEYLERITALRSRALKDLTSAISENAQNSMAQARLGATRKAAAEGRLDAVDMYALPQTAAIASQSAKQQAEAVGALNRQFDQAEIDVEGAYANRPMQPNVADYIMKLGSSATKLVDAIRQAKYLDDLNSPEEEPQSAVGKELPEESTGQHPPGYDSQFGITSPVEDSQFGIKYGGTNEMLDMYRQAYGQSAGAFNFNDALAGIKRNTRKLGFNRPPGTTPLGRGY